MEMSWEISEKLLDFRRLVLRVVGDEYTRRSARLRKHEYYYFSLLLSSFCYRALFHSPSLGSFYVNVFICFLVVFQFVSFFCCFFCVCVCFIMSILSLFKLSLFALCTVFQSIISLILLSSFHISSFVFCPSLLITYLFILIYSAPSTPLFPAPCKNRHSFLFGHILQIFCRVSPSFFPLSIFPFSLGSSPYLLSLSLYFFPSLFSSVIIAISPTHPLRS